jgi:hypothetical protein
LNGIREWWADHKEAWHDKKKAIERADASIAIILSHPAPEDCMGDWSVLEKRMVSPEEESRNRLANSNRQVRYLKRWKESHLQWFRENAVLMDKIWYVSCVEYFSTHPLVLSWNNARAVPSRIG